jgi:hypothetical protein
MCHHDNGFTQSRKLNMFSAAVVAIDGSKFKAVNNKKKNYTPQKARSLIERVEKQIEDCRRKRDATDGKAVSNDDTPREAKITELELKLTELKKLEKAVETHPDKQISTIDPDSRLMKVTGMIRRVGYNVQTVVDTQHHLIVAHEVTNRCSGQGSALQHGQAGMIALVPKGDTSGAKLEGIFNRSAFHYDRDKDVYLCPAGNELPCHMLVVEDGLQQKVYFDCKSCGDCGIRSRCTKSKKDPRKIRRWILEGMMEEMQALLDSHPKTTIIRRQTVEHAFGTIKAWMGATHFLTKRLKNVSTEMNLHVLANNFRRVLTIMGTNDLIKAMAA